MFFRDRRHRFVQRAVNAVLYSDFRISSFDMNVTRTPLERGEDDGIQETDNGAGLLLGDLLDRDGLFAGFVFTYEVELEFLSCFVEHALRRFGFLEQVLNFGKRRHIDDECTSEKGGYLINDNQIARVR